MRKRRDADGPVLVLLLLTPRTMVWRTVAFARWAAAARASVSKAN